jgi:predicted RNase H-like nuclease (RuvC/YqgF family)
MNPDTFNSPSHPPETVDAQKTQALDESLNIVCSLRNKQNQSPDQTKTILQLEAENAELKAKNTDLEAQLQTLKESTSDAKNRMTIEERIRNRPKIVADMTLYLTGQRTDEDTFFNCYRLSVHQVKELGKLHSFFGVKGSLLGSI